MFSAFDAALTRMREAGKLNISGGDTAEVDSSANTEEVIVNGINIMEPTGVESNSGFGSIESNSSEFSNTESITTEPITTGSITTEPITTEPITTTPITTTPITTEPITTIDPTIHIETNPNNENINHQPINIDSETDPDDISFIGGKRSKKSSSKKSKTPKKKTDKSESTDKDTDKSESSNDMDLSEIEELIDSMLNNIAGGKTERFTINKDKKNVFVIVGIIAKDIFDALKAEKLTYLNIDRIETEAYVEVMKNIDNVYTPRDKRSYLIAEELSKRIKSSKENVILAKLSNPTQYNSIDLLDILSKDKTIDISFVNYQTKYLFTIGLERLKHNFFSKPTAWFFNPYNNYFTKSKKGEVIINKKDVLDEMSNWKRFYDSEKNMKEEVNDFFGSSDELQLTPKFKFTKIMSL